MVEGEPKPERPEDSEKDQKTSISHYVGNWLAKGNLTTKKGGSAESFRAELIEKLRLNANGRLIDEAIKLVEGADWSTESGVDSFRTSYNEFKERIGIKQ